MKLISAFVIIFLCISGSVTYAQKLIKATEEKLVPEIQWKHNYHQTLMMKLFMSEVDRVQGQNRQVKIRDKGESRVEVNFEQAMDIIKRVDQITLGIPKIIYLVGWQYNGHDSKYPAWDEVNPALKRPQDKTALESMLWLMEEARKYNTTVSVHINMFDAYDDSPLWDTYVENDIIARNADGTLKTGEWGYPISYTQEWKTGYAQKRIDRICDMLQLAKAGTVHIDAFHTWSPFEDPGPISPYLGYTLEEESATQEKIYRYWASKGVDVTSEGVKFLRISAFEGLQPAAWWVGFSPEESMQWPASYYCGGVDNGEQGKLFGTSMHGEDIFRKDAVNLPDFIRQFCLKTLPWYYLNRLQRLEYTEDDVFKEVHFSEGVVSHISSNEGYSIRKGEKILLHNGDVFMPALWVNVPAIIAYSTNGYRQKEWVFTDDWKNRKSVDIYRITVNGIQFVTAGKVITDNKITLSLNADEALVIVPSDETNFLKGKVAEERYILTPPESPLPHINGAKITGASANKPFMFRIATTGERPMKFEAKGLPKGLVLNSTDGLITGKCKKKGRYIVPVTASNSKGICNDTIEIVIGGDLALTPHMGWNSWYIYGPDVTQEIMEKSAQAMYDEGLVNYGYTFVNIDDGWQLKIRGIGAAMAISTRKADKTIRTNGNFPDMKGLADFIHSLGMKAGLYSSPGGYTCGGYAGSLGYEPIDIKTYNDWGFDFLKYDWCSYADEVKSSPVTLEEYKKPYELMGNLLKKGKRDIILNMCQYGMDDVWKWGKEVGGQSWRTTGDIGDTRNLLASMFRIGFFQEKLKDYSGPGGWNDPDYLLFGDIYNFDTKTQIPSPYSASEHYTCMTLWCMMSAPLIFSGNITTLDDFTRNILCNAEVIAVNQDKLGKQGYSIYKKDLVEIWKKELSDGTTAIAIFNKRSIKDTIEVDWEEFGYRGNYKVRDLWRQTDLGPAENNKLFEIPRHGCVMLKMAKQ